MLRVHLLGRYECVSVLLFLHEARWHSSYQVFSLLAVKTVLLSHHCECLMVNLVESPYLKICSYHSYVVDSVRWVVLSKPAAFFSVLLDLVTLNLSVKRRCQAA